MDITQLARKPELTKLTIDAPEILEQYGEPLEFYMMDRQPMERFVKLAGKQITEENYHEVIGVMKSLVLDAQGNPVMDDDRILPWDVMLHCVSLVMGNLGKSQTAS